MLMLGAHTDLDYKLEPHKTQRLGKHTRKGQT